ncbi:MULTISPECIES: PAS domain-containing protein [unclassified Massilia]|uniref:PAS domain-containing protein n=1 Tax=unclassified Massilia TaxID=2609279 RepID=UPI00177FC65A|nr:MULTISPECIES: PAS domain-containing protein [unclassified Massilia]MBD8532514.1 PAS domain-containing protein [Massilia sp. CFBP 13647]MBD8675885.1 PAS domain-containing protein [Massilia sp. CFBP 13721]
MHSAIPDSSAAQAPFAPAFMAKLALEAVADGSDDSIAERYNVPAGLVTAWRQQLQNSAEQLFTGELAEASMADPRIAALEQMETSIAILASDELRYTYANPAYRAAIGSGDPIGKRMRDVFPNSMVDGVEAGIRHVLSTGQAWDVRNFRTEMPGVGETWWEGRISRMPASAGVPPSVVIWIRDVTTNVQREQSLRRQVALLQAVCEGSPDPMFAKDRDGRFLVANPAALQLIGKTQESVIGKTDADVLRDPDAAAAIMANDRRVMASGQAEELEEEVPLPDGTARIWLSQKRPHRDADGAVIGLFGVSRDITDRKSAEERVRAAHGNLQRVLDSITDGLAVLDRNWNYTYFSETGATMLGVRSADLIGKNFWDLFPHAAQLMFGKEYRRAMDTGVVTHFEDYYPEPLNKWVECRCYPSPDGLSVYFRDVSDRRRAQDAADENERRIHALLEATPVGLAYADASGRMLVLNSEAKRIWGNPPHAGSVAEYADWKGWWADKSARHGQRIGAAEWPMAQALRGERVADVVVEIAPFDSPGTRRIILVRAVPMKDDSGRITGAVTAHTDITDSGQSKAAVLESNYRLSQLARESENGLRLSEERFRTLIMASSQIVWHCDPEGAVHEDSLSWRGYTGQSFEAWQGFGWLDALHPSERASSLAKLQDCIDKKQVYTNEQRLRRADGIYRWHAVRAVPILLPDGSIREWVGANTDIQDRKQAEIDRQRFVSLAERSNDFVGMCDLFFRPFFLNRAAIEMVGGHAKKWDVSNIEELFFPEDLDFIKNTFLPRVMREGHAEVELRLRHLVTNAPIWMIYSVYALLDRDGQPEGYASVSRNITERKAAEEKLHRLATDLADANDRKTEFLATLAHELRNPLAPIRTGLDLMRLANNNPASLGRARDMMDRQLRQMVHLIDDLMDISRINSGKIELKRSKVAFQPVVMNAVESVLPLVERAGHKLEVDIPEAQVWLDADPTRLAQVLGNLLTNACKYTPNGGTIVLAAALDGPHAPHELVIRITDTGIGIPAESLAAVFEMFNQVSQNMGHAQGGLGIGLALVRSLVEMHGGSVSAASAGPGQGSAFTVRLPILAADEDAPAAAPHLETSMPAATRARVLIADDNADAGAMLAALLETAGHAVTVVHDGRAALARAAESGFDLVILDIGMPGMSGYEAAAAIRKLPHMRDAILAAHTGWGTDVDRLKTAEAGFDVHLTKPVGLPELGGVFARLEERRRQVLS